MADPSAEIKTELADLISKGIAIHNSEFDEGKENPTDGRQPLPLPFRYQSWYTRCLPVVRDLLPERYVEFQELYRNERRKEIQYDTYTISDYLMGLRVTRGLAQEEVFSSRGAFSTKLLQQISIVRSAISRLDSILRDIRGVLQAELFDGELSAARDLLRANHLRAAGTVAGVVLERHLAQVALTHAITLRKRTPTIGDLNEALKAANVYDLPPYREILRLGDIRNLCAHSKERDPTKEEVSEMVDGVDKIAKTVW
jgi:hypothetical protein